MISKLINGIKKLFGFESKYAHLVKVFRQEEANKYKYKTGFFIAVGNRATDLDLQLVRQAFIAFLEDRFISTNHSITIFENILSEGVLLSTKDKNAMRKLGYNVFQLNSNTGTYIASSKFKLAGEAKLNKFIYSVSEKNGAHLTSRVALSILTLVDRENFMSEWDFGKVKKDLELTAFSKPNIGLSCMDGTSTYHIRFTLDTKGYTVYDDELPQLRGLFVGDHSWIE